MEKALPSHYLAHFRKRVEKFETCLQTYSTPLMGYCKKQLHDKIFSFLHFKNDEIVLVGCKGRIKSFLGVADR